MDEASKIALVTGAGSGIGRGCALALLAAGWRVVFNGRRLEPLEAAIEESRVSRDRAIAIPCDVAQQPAVAEMFAMVAERFGRLDLLFNNAGIGGRSALPDELSSASWRETVDINLHGTFHCLSAAFKQMRHQTPRGGRIINNGSLSAHVPRPLSIAYAATKHAVTGLTRAAALDGRAYDIAVGQIDIGNVETGMTDRMSTGVTQADGSFKPEPRMDLASVTATFMTMANLPLSANVLFMTVMATQMPYVGRG